VTSWIRFGLVGDEVFVGDDVDVQAVLRHLIGQRDDLLHTFQPIADLLEDREQVGVGEDQAIVGVADDVGQVFR
jgi:hypothetical protein